MVQPAFLMLVNRAPEMTSEIAEVETLGATIVLGILGVGAGVGVEPIATGTLPGPPPSSPPGRNQGLNPVLATRVRNRHSRIIVITN